MKCPDDGTNMEKGMLASHGQWWVNKILRTFAGFLMGGGNKVIAWRCPKCKKIMLYTE